MNTQILRYYMHDGPSAFRFELAGDLAGEETARLDRDWRAVSRLMGAREIIVDLTFVTGWDREGRALLAGWQAAGARFIANSEPSRQLFKTILDESVPASAPASAAKNTFRPFHLLLAAAVLLPAQTRAANLRTETVAAWESSTQSVEQNLQARVAPGGQFLWSRESTERLAYVHRGGIAIAPAHGPNPLKVKGGLIHHWMGAAFMVGAKLEDILVVTRDYDRYKEFYQPSVIESRTQIRNASEERFSMQLMNRALFLKLALDADYQVRPVRLDPHRFYSVSRTTRVQELEDAGQPGAHLLPEGAGTGYIWKLFSIARLEESDGGVYIEMETLALSREIPSALRPVVDPIVRRVSHNSLLLSLEQTQRAARGSALAGGGAVARTSGISAAGNSANDGPVAGIPSPPASKIPAFLPVH